MDWNNVNTDKDTSGLGPIEYDQTKVPALIRKHADNVRTKTYGQEVREAQARNAELAGLIASEAVDISNETKGRQDTIETQFNSVQQELTDKDPISAPEIIVARNGEPTLSARLDKEYQEVTAKLARIEYNASEFCVVGDGVHDDTLALQEAITTSKNSKLSFEKNSLIKISGSMNIDLDNDVEIDGNGSTIILEGGERNVLRVQSTHFKTIQITALEKNQSVIELVNVDGLAVGDGLVIESDEIFAERIGYPIENHYRKGFTTKVRDIVGNSIHIDPLPYSFTSGFTTTLKFYKKNSFILKNVTIINNGTDINRNSIFLENVFEGYIENITIKNDDYACMVLSNTCDFNIKNIEIGAKDVVNIDLNYGIYLNGSTNTILDNLHIETIRHCIMMIERPCVNIDIRNSRLHSKSGASVDSHSSWSYKVTNCFLYSVIFLGIGFLQMESCEIILNKVGKFAFSLREDVSKYFRGLSVKNCNIQVDEAAVPFYLMKLSDVYTEEVGTILIDNVNVVSKTPIDAIIALQHSKISDNFGNVIIKNSNFNGLVRYAVFYYGETVGVISKGNQLKKKCHIDNNVFEQLGAVTNALNLFSIFTFVGNTLDSSSQLRVSPLKIGFLTAVTYINNNIMQQGSLFINGVQDVFVNGNTIYYPTGNSVVTNCTKVTVTKNLLNGPPKIDFTGNISRTNGGFIHVGWNRRLSRVDTNCEINLPADYINLET